jgi:hypothetical protein
VAASATQAGWCYGLDSSGSVCVDLGLYWKGKLVGSPEIFLCPIHVDEFAVYRGAGTNVYWKTDIITTPAHKNSARFWGSYAMNSNVYSGNEPRLHSDFSSNHILFVEEDPVNSNFNDSQIGEQTGEAIAGRHQGYGYIACMDGHVTKMTLANFANTLTNPDLKKRYWTPE